MPRISIRDPSSSTIDDPRSLRALHPVKTKRKRQTSLREISVIWTRGFSTRGILSRGYRSTSRMASRFSLETNYVGVFIHVASRCVHQLPRAGRGAAAASEAGWLRHPSWSAARLLVLILAGCRLPADQRSDPVQISPYSRTFRRPRTPSTRSANSTPAHTRAERTLPGD